MIKLIRRCCRCTKGGTALEFALVAGLLFTMIFGVVEYSLYSLANVLLDGSMREASRFGITGFTPAGVSRDDKIRDVVSKTTMGLVDINDPSFKLDVLVYPSFDDIGLPEPFDDNPPLGNLNGVYDVGENYTDINGNGQWDPDMGLSSSGGPGAVVLYTASYDWPLWTYLATLIGGSDGKLPLSSSIAVRNEPWTPPPAPPPGP
jgi:hypothetical protein